jgi:hypothetical protein
MSALSSSIAIVLLASLAMVGCSERAEQPHVEAAPTMSSTQSNAPLAAATQKDSQNALHAKITTGAMTASYRAHFEDGQLKRIAEERRDGAKPRQKGEYTFYGARLVEYTGDKLDGGDIRLQFDMQGALLSPRGALTDAEVGAVVNRAQLLRSHALAQRSTQSHY